MLSASRSWRAQTLTREAFIKEGRWGPHQYVDPNLMALHFKWNWRSTSKANAQLGEWILHRLMYTCMEFFIEWVIQDATALQYPQYHLVTVVAHHNLSPLQKPVDFHWLPEVRPRSRSPQRLLCLVLSVQPRPAHRCFLEVPFPVSDAW